MNTTEAFSSRVIDITGERFKNARNESKHLDMSLRTELRAIEDVQKEVGTCPVAPEACGSLNASQLLLQVNFNDVSNNLT